MKEIKDVNFIPNQSKEKLGDIKKKIGLVFWGTVCIAIIAILFAAPKLVFKYELSRQKNINQQLRSLSDVANKVAMLKEITDNKKEKEDALKDIEKNQIRVVELTNKVNDAIPKNISIKSFALNDRQLNISFVLNSPVDLVNLITSLENLNIFEKVDVGSFMIVDGSQTISFSLKIK